MQYVILEHRFSESVHWDLLFELPGGAGLRGWAVAGFPLSPGWTPARLLAPHRPVYLNYEGPVYRIGGWVRRVDEGKHEVLYERPDEVRLRLHGQRHRGILESCLRDLQWSCRFSSHSEHNRSQGLEAERFPLSPRSSQFE